VTTKHRRQKIARALPALGTTLSGRSASLGAPHALVAILQLVGASYPQWPTVRTSSIGRRLLFAERRRPKRSCPGQAPLSLRLEPGLWSG